MALEYQKIATTPSVQAARRHYYGRTQNPGAAVEGEHTPLGPDEAAFVTARDSFYVASVSETGWPYLQHRGGPTGFLRVLDPRTLAFADLQGNRQLISTGNVNRRTVGNTLRAFAAFMSVPFRPGFDPVRYAHAQSHPMPPRPQLAVDSARWRAEHGVSLAFAPAVSTPLIVPTTGTSLA